VHLISIFFDPLAQLITASVAEVNIKYFYITIYQTYTLRYNNSRRDRTRSRDCMTFVYVYVVNQKVNRKLIRKFFIPKD